METQSATFFDDEELWAELNSRDASRRRLAHETVDAIAELARMRAAASRLSYQEARRDVFCIVLLERDMSATTEAARRHVATRVASLLTKIAGRPLLPTGRSEPRTQPLVRSR